MAKAVKLCNHCSEPIVWREEIIPKPERRPPDFRETQWVPVEASLQDPSQPEHFAQGQYEERGRTRISLYGTKPKLLVKHVCKGELCFSSREEGRMPSWRDWG
jgi:hypothetical protein